jgi:cytochrome c553
MQMKIFFYSTIFLLLLFLLFFFLLESSSEGNIKDINKNQHVTSVEMTPEFLYRAKCSACHGIFAEKVALNESQIIKGWSKQKIINAIEGYQNGSYGKTFKKLMHGQIKDLDKKNINLIANYISNIK